MAPHLSQSLRTLWHKESHRINRLFLSLSACSPAEIDQRCKLGSPDAFSECCKQYQVCKKMCTPANSPQSGGIEGFLCSGTGRPLFINRSGKDTKDGTTIECTCAEQQPSDSNAQAKSKANAASRQQVPGALLLMASGLLAAVPLVGIL